MFGFMTENQDYKFFPYDVKGIEIDTIDILLFSYKAFIFIQYSKAFHMT